MICGLKTKSAESALRYWICFHGTGIILENIGGITMSKKYPTCPECKNKNVALIFWGYPGDVEWYLEAIAKKEIVGGGCTISDHDPRWECNSCHHTWGERED